MEESSHNAFDDGVDKEEIEQFLQDMDEYVPTIPDEVTNYYLRRAGYVCPDTRVQRVIALAAQKFISEIAETSRQYNEVRNQSTKRKKVVLTMEDLTQSLKEYGISIHKPPYFADNPTTGITKKKFTGTKRKRPPA